MKNVVVVGSGRSGTSMLAGVLAHAGYFVGREPYPARAANPKGFFESKDLNGLNEWLIASVEPRESQLGAWQRWLSVLPSDVQFELTVPIRERMRRLTAHAPFCFKDPRFAFTLPAWRDALGDARYLCVFREPAATAASILKECAEAEYLRGVEFDFERALELWNASYRRILDVHRRSGEWLFLHFDQVLDARGLDRLEAFVETSVARDFPDAQWKRSRGERAVSESVAETYRELCALAEHAAAPIATFASPPSARSVVERERHDVPELSVILCTYNRRETLREALASFEAQDAPRGSFELVVVDDGSTDGTAALLADHRFQIPARTLRRENGGLAAARNSGLAVARGEIVLLVNDDTLAFPDLVSRHLAAHRAHAGEKLCVLGTFEQPARALDRALMSYLELTDDVFCYSSMKSGEFYDWNRFWTANVSVPRAALTEIGGFDESFRRYGCEDTDVALRLDALGFRVLFDGTARAHHRHLLDLGSLEKRQRTVAQAWVHLFAKHPRAMEHADWNWVKSLTLADCEREVEERLPDLPRCVRAARELGGLDLHALRGVAELDGAADALLERLGRLIRELNRLWWRQGFAAGLTELGLASFDELAPPTPWPLATQARTKLLAWPNWTRADLDHLMREFAPVCAGRDDVCLVLVLDPVLDSLAADARGELAAAYTRRFADGEALEVLVLDDALGERECRRLGMSVDGLLELPSTFDAPRKAFVDAVGRPLLRNAEQLARQLERLSRAETPLASR